jgi:predicted AlkP superfamily pyrophosphatase or phosphodiesterase
MFKQVQSLHLWRDLIFITLLYSAGLFLYFRGFFLTRFELLEFNSCDAFSVKKFNPLASTKSNRNDSCWMHGPPRYDRVIVLLVDALRYDFINPVDEDETINRDSNSNSNPQESYYLNKMQNVRSLLQTNPSQAKLFNAFVDSPTVTMQRLKALTTGSLPTFLEISANFGSTAIQDDNLLYQFAYGSSDKPSVSNRKKLIFAGDDMWTNLYPVSNTSADDSGKNENLFYKAYPYPSFDVSDLDSVDAHVEKIFHRYLATETPPEQDDDWFMLVGHMLGVDHVGHKLGPNCPDMTRKLRQADAFIHWISNRILSLDEAQGKRTLFVVLGDHGMTSGGNHGGASQEESQAGVFLFSSIPISEEVEVGDHYRSNKISQIDLVPTLAFLLGKATPFASIGLAMKGVSYFADPKADNASRPLLHSVSGAHASVVNMLQVHTYLRAFQDRQALFADVDVESIEGKVRETMKEYRNLLNESMVMFGLDGEGANAEQDHGIGAKHLRASYGSDVLEDALMKYARVHDYASRNSPGWDLSPVLEQFRLAQTKSASITTTIASLCRKQWTQFNELFMVVGIVLLFVCTVYGIVVLALQFHNADMSKKESKYKDKPISWTFWVSKYGIPVILGIGVRMWALFTDTFIVREPLIITVLILSMLASVAWTGCKIIPSSSLKITLLTLITGSLVIGLHPPNGWIHLLLFPFKEFDLSLQNSDTFRRPIVEPANQYEVPLLSWVLLVIFPLVCWYFPSVLVNVEESIIGKKKDGNQVRKTDGNVRIFHALLSLLQVVFVALYWSNLNSISRENRNHFAHATYACSVLGSVISRFVFDLSSPSNRLSLGFSQVSISVPSFLLLLGVHSPAYIVAFLVIVSNVSILLQILLSNPLSADFKHEISLQSPTFHRIVHFITTDPLVPISFLLSLLPWLLFYVTGHGNSFSELHIHTAFVGFDSFEYFRSGALLTMNTYAGHFLTFLVCKNIWMRNEHLRGNTNEQSFSTRFKFILTVVLSTPLIASTIFCLYARRHLMVWAIFAPKLLFDVAAFGVTLPSLFV